MAGPPSVRRVFVVAVVTAGALVLAVVLGLVIGPTPISAPRILGDAFSHLGLGHSTLTSIQSSVVWQLRAPRMVLGLLAGAMLAVAGGCSIEKAMGSVFRMIRSSEVTSSYL